MASWPTPEPILEYPLTTFRLLGKSNLPVAGGGYLRILPLWYTRMGRALSRRADLPLILYTHPWEIDPDQPRLAGRLKSRFRHYTNLGRTHSRLRALIGQNRHVAFESSNLAASTQQTVDLRRLKA